MDMEFRQERIRRVYSFCLLFLVCMAWRASAQDKFGPVLVSAVVLEEEVRTNGIEITWNEGLAIGSMTLINFKVVLTASNVVAPIAFGENVAGNPAKTI